jgi:hypothetical protein
MAPKRKRESSGIKMISNPWGKVFSSQPFYFVMLNFCIILDFYLWQMMCSEEITFLTS